MPGGSCVAYSHMGVCYSLGLPKPSYKYKTNAALPFARGCFSLLTWSPGGLLGARRAVAGTPGSLFTNAPDNAQPSSSTQHRPPWNIELRLSLPFLRLR